MIKPWLLGLLGFLSFHSVHGIQAPSTNECLMRLATNTSSLHETGCINNPMVRAFVSDETIVYFTQMYGWTGTVDTEPPRSYGDGQCAMDDWLLDVMRAGALSGYIQALAPWYARPYEECYDKYECMDVMSNIMENDVVYTMGSGLGTYRGLEKTCEYLAIPTQAIGVDLVRLSSIPTERDYFIFQPDMIVAGSYATSAFAFNRTIASNFFVEWTVKYSPCGYKMAALTANDFKHFTGERTEIAKGTAPFYLMQKLHVKQYSTKFICKTHETFCTGANRQYESFDKCEKYMEQLPLKTPECGTVKMMYGHALPCIYKHSLMVAINPDLHCGHIGPSGMDMEGNHKCHAGECANVANPMNSKSDWAQFDQFEAKEFVKYMNKQPIKLGNACQRTGPRQPLTSVPEAPKGYKRNLRGVFVSAQ